LKPYLQADTTVSASFKDCLEKCLQQLQQCENIDQQTLDPIGELRKKSILRASVIDDILSLIPGQKRLVIVNKDPNDLLFYLFSKEKIGLTFKIMGRGPTMELLTKLILSDITNGIKIRSAITYLNMPENTAGNREWLEKLFIYSCIGKGLDTSAVASHLELFKGLLVNASQDNSLKKKTDHLFKSLWTTFKHTGFFCRNSNDKASVKLLQLRLEIASLFAAYQACRNSLTAGSEEFQSLEALLRAVSEDVLLAYRKKYLTLRELTETVRELTQIKNTLNRAQAEAVCFSTTVKNWGMGIYINAKQSDLNISQPLSIKKRSSIKKNPRDPSSHPMNDSTIPFSQLFPEVVFYRSPKITDLHSLHDHLENLIHTFPLSKAVRAVHGLDFSPYKKLKSEYGRRSYTLDHADVWVQLSKADSVRIMKQLSLLSEAISEEIKTKFSLACYEALLKICTITLFLTTRHFEWNGQFSYSYGSSSCPLSILSERIREIDPSDPYSFMESSFERRGYRMQPYSHSVVAQLALIGKEIEVKKCDYLSAEQAQENYQDYIKQMALVEKVSPFRQSAFPLVSKQEGSLANWMLPLKHPLLLAIYYNLCLRISKDDHTKNFKIGELMQKAASGKIRGMSIQSGDSGNIECTGISQSETEWLKQESIKQLHRNDGMRTPEAIADDPQQVVDFLWEELKEIVEAADPQHPLLNRSAFHQQSPYFTREETAALLFLSRQTYPQIEITAFIEKFPDLQKYAEVRNFLDMLFFNGSLAMTLKDRQQFTRNLPKYLEEKIVYCHSKSLEDPSYISQLIFYMQWSEKLKTFYKTKGYSIDEFCNKTHSIIQELFKQAKVEARLFPYMHVLLTMQLQLLLIEPALSTQAVHQVLVYYMLRKSMTGDPLQRDPFVEQFIEEKYEEILQTLISIRLPYAAISPVLEEITHWKKLAASSSPWQGAFPAFQNDLYIIDLKAGSVKEKQHNFLIGSSLPEEVVLDPFFKIAFKGLEVSATDFSLFEADGRKIWSFEDQEGRTCQIEAKDGNYHYYKTLPVSDKSLKMLQIVDFTRLQPSLKLEGMCLLLNLLSNDFKKPSIPCLPYIFDHGLYFDPANRWEGLCITDKGELLFKVQFGSWLNVWIKSIHDCRDNSGPWEVMSGEDVKHSAVQRLSCFEHPSQMLLWGNNGILERIELPRFNLQFFVKDESLFCQTPAFKNFKVELHSNDQQKKQIAFSLLLSPPEQGMPSKLIVPESAAFTMNIHRPLPWNSSIAWLMWFMGALKQPQESIKLNFENTHSGKILPFFTLDIRPCTEELVCSKSQQLFVCLEIAKQMLLQNKYELAFRCLESFPLKKDHLTIPHKNAIVDFLSKSHSDTSFEAAVKLKHMSKIVGLIQGDALHDHFRKQLDSLIPSLLSSYRLQGKKISQSIQLTNEEIACLEKGIAIQNESSVELKSIEALESAVSPGKKIGSESSGTPSFYIENGPFLIFEETALSAFFDKKKEPFLHFSLPSVGKEAPACERKSIDIFRSHFNKFVQKERYLFTLTDDPQKLSTFGAILKQKSTYFNAEKVSARKIIDTLLTKSDDPAEQAAIYGKVKVMASYDELMLAMLQNNLAALKIEGRLPIDVDCTKLRKALIRYFDAEVRSNLAEMCQRQFSALQIFSEWEEKDQAWEIDSSLLYQALTSRRHYDLDSHPELLVFEALKWLTYRSSNGETNQLYLLNDMLRQSTGVTIAATGVGKTKVLSVLRSLMQPNGKNLVTQIVLPALYAQTLDVMEKDIGGIFRGMVCPFRFDMKKRLEEKEMVYEDVNGAIKPVAKTVSAFKKMYRNLLQVIEGRGCLLTDYKSFPLLRAKFVKLSREFLAKRRENVSVTDMELSHWSYLRKILVLLRHKSEGMMDELDQPNRPIHRIQLAMEKPKKPGAFLITESLKIYNLLLQQKELLLRENLQYDVAPEVRKKCLENIAHILAKELAFNAEQTEKIRQYILGLNEDVLTQLSDWSLHKKDSLAFYKDQLTIYLPSTLCQRGSSKYARSDDGKRILPCLGGEKHDAKFGSVIEEINYMIQDYVQRGVTTIELKEWIQELLKAQLKGYESAQETFQQIFPKRTLQEMDPEGLINLSQEVNNSIQKIWYFLQLRLNEITVSGSVVSIDPQDAISMHRSVAGISATLGCAQALHSQFKVDTEAAGHIQASMAYRLIKRIEGPVLEYNPHKPEEVLIKAQKIHSVCAIIDGAGAFLQIDPQHVSEKIKLANPSLQRVGFYNEEGQQDYQGDRHALINQSGFYFSEPNTRGADVQLPENGAALLTVGNQGSLESLNQQEGRMRRPGQKIILARSQLATHLKTAGDIISKKIRYEANEHAQDLFKAKRAELSNILKTASWDHLLAIEELPAFLAAFEKFEELFISPSPSTYDLPGEYFSKNKVIRKCNRTPLDVLNAICRQYKEKSRELQLDEAYLELDKIHYPADLLEMMPEYVYMPEDDAETGLELELEEEQEQELELENEQEREMELENEKQSKAEVPYYLPRLSSEVTYRAQEKIHPAYDPSIYFTASFLPLERIDPLYVRKPYDDKMYRVGVISCKTEYQLGKGLFSEICLVPKEFILGDVLDETEIKKTFGFLYDIRTGQVIASRKDKLPLKSSLSCSPEESLKKFINSDSFRRVIAQIKFLDGETEEYTDQEMLLLKEWILKNGLETMREHFEMHILKHRGELRATYHCSKLYKLLNS
jgi:hypothetical protein